MARNFDRVKILRKQVTDRLYAQILPVTDAEEFSNEIEDALVKNWKANILSVPKISGWLRDILTRRDSGLTVRARSGAVTIDIAHPGVLYVASVLAKVQRAADVPGAIRAASEAQRAKNSSRSLRRGRRRRR